MPGHTPADVAYRIGDTVFVGDTVFMPDFGTARTDFPGGDAAFLYRSIRRLLSLPPETRLFMCHDYKTPGRDVYAWESDVAAQRAGKCPPARRRQRGGVRGDARGAGRRPAAARFALSGDPGEHEGGALPAARPGRVSPAATPRDAARERKRPVLKRKKVGAGAPKSAGPSLVTRLEGPA
jgi:glyoxylase-like metal-dependent hydrolase (beta-lactamase superfamily II)